MIFCSMKLEAFCGFQEASNWTVQVTNSEFSGTAVTAQLDVIIDLASKTGLMEFRCNFVAIDPYHKHQYQIKSWTFEAPGKVVFSLFIIVLIPILSSACLCSAPNVSGY